MKKCVFLTIMGDYDNLNEPTVITPGWDYICFTNNPKLKSKSWDIRFVTDDEGLGNPKFSRKIWILNHRHVGEYDLSISIDGSMYPNCNLDVFIKKFLPADDKIDMAMHDRKIREGVYHEAVKCSSKGKADPELIRRQMDFYRSEGMPGDTGIFSTGVIIRKHNRPNLERHCELWWEQVEKWAHRDQLSINYIVWKYNLINISFFDCDILRGPGNYFQKTKHRGRKK